MTGTLNLLQAVQDQLNCGSTQLPVYSATAHRLQTTVAQENVDSRQIEAVLGQDPALAAQVLRVANSPFYGGLSKVNTLSGAAQRLGLRQVVNIATLTAQRAAHSSTDVIIQRFMKQLWRHSVGCALGAKWLAEQANSREIANEAFMAGLIHDVGALLLLKVIESLRQGEAKALPLQESLMLEIMTAFHAEQGARLIRHWGLPESYALIAEAHHLEKSDGDTLMHLVRLADNACHKIGVALVPENQIKLSATREAEILGVREVTLAELELVIEDGVAALA